MQLIPGLKYLRGNDGFIYCFNKIKAKRKDMTEFIAEGDEQEPVTEMQIKKAERKEEVKKAKARGRSKKARGKDKKAGSKVSSAKQTPVTAADMSGALEL